MPLVILHHLLNVSVQLANKRGFEQTKNSAYFAHIVEQESLTSEVCDRQSSFNHFYVNIYLAGKYRVPIDGEFLTLLLCGLDLRCGICAPTLHLSAASYRTIKSISAKTNSIEQQQLRG
jgi:hypothetical protein